MFEFRLEKDFFSKFFCRENDKICQEKKGH